MSEQNKPMNFDAGCVLARIGRTQKQAYGLFAGVLLSVPLFAAPTPAAPNATQDQSASTSVQSTQQQQTQITKTEEDKITERAKLFDLTKEDWMRYEEIMKGPQGFKGANADPVMVLGTFAKTNAERQKYAEIAARNEKKYFDNMLAFQRAYGIAAQKLHGKKSAFDPSVPTTGEYELPTEIPKFSGGFQPGDRVIFFTQVKDCEACDTRLTQLIALLNEHKQLGLDVYTVDSAKKDKLVQEWAVSRQIPVKAVKAKTITLNHENGELFRIDNTRTAPAVLLRRGTQYFDLEGG